MQDILDSARWKHPQHYFGFSPDGDYLICAQHRESDTISRSNFAVATKTLGAEFFASRDTENRPTAYIFRASCSMVGWIEYLLIRADAPAETIASGAEILEKIDVYPILDDSHHSELEYSEVCDFWKGLSVRSRAEYLARCGLSIFAARRDYLPENDTGALYEMLRG